MKLSKIVKSDTSIKQLVDVDASAGIKNCVDCIANGMILVASVSKNIAVKDSFVFKNLTDVIKVSTGLTASVVNGVMTLSSALESIALTDLIDVNITSPVNEDILSYNSVTSKWENISPTWVPETRHLTINGVTQDLSTNRTWTISTGGGSGTVTSVVGTGTVSGLTLSGTVTTSGNLTLGGTLSLTSGNVTSALGYTPYDSTNPSNYITSAALSSYLTIASASSTYLTISNAASTYLTIASAAITYQPIFTTQNGLTYSSGYLKLGGLLTEHTTINGDTNTYNFNFTNVDSSVNTASKVFSVATSKSGNNALISLDSDTNISTFSHTDAASGDVSAIELLGTEMRIKTPGYASASNNSVLTLIDKTTGEAEWQSPTGGSGGLQYGTASGTNTYTVTISGVAGYTDGDTYVVKFTNGSDDDSTININGLGAKLLTKEFDVQLTGGDIASGQELIIIYDGTNFQTLGVAPNQLFAYVTNADSVTINKGQPVYAFGASGNRMSVKLAYNTLDTTSAQTVGVVFSTSIAAGQKGFIITQGVISGVNTGAYSAGNQLYLGATAGTLTATKPSAPNHLVYIGIVERANAGNGQIYIKPQNGYELDELHDVDLKSVGNTPVNNDVLTYVTGTDNLWKPRSISTILGYTPAGLSSPAFTGTPTAPTAATGTNTTQIATTAFVQTATLNTSISQVGIFGDGATSGTTTITSNISLSDDAYYENLTITTGTINANGYRIFVSGTLDLTNAGANAIYNNGVNQANQAAGTCSAIAAVRGGIGNTVSGYGSAQTGVAVAGVGGGCSALSGAGPAGNAATALGTSYHCCGGGAGAGGAGGASTGAGGAGGAGQSNSTLTPANFYFRTLHLGANNLNSLLTRYSLTSAGALQAIPTAGGRHGGAGGSGGGSSAASGTIGGGGGSGAGVIVLFAKTISLGGSTNSAAISARGGNGGNGSSSSFNSGSGGGGGGGGGGYVYIVASSISSTGINYINVSGGNGGDGGTTTSLILGNGGTGGTGGNGGRATIINLSANTITQYDYTANAGTAATTATTRVGTTGGAGYSAIISS